MSDRLAAVAERDIRAPRGGPANIASRL